MQPKFFIFGIDGGTFDLIEPLIAENLLPNLAALLARGASARMDCTWPPHTGPGWTSLVTSCYPGHHAIYQFFAMQESDYRARVVGSNDYGCSTVWEWLALQGWTMGIINIPMSHPPRSLPGYQITWPLSNTLRYCSPHTLLGEMANHGAHFQSDLATMYRGDLNYIHEALDNVEARLRSLKYLLAHHPVDAAMIVFTEVDRVCHHYWHFSDPTHPQFTPDADEAYRSAIRDIYQAVDHALGEALRLIPEESTVVVVSDHGFGAGRESFSVHRHLEQAGWLKTRAAVESPAAGSNGHAEVASWFKEGGREIDWERTRLYMPVPGGFGLNVNLKGRQRQGIVDETDRLGLLQEASELLRAVKSPSTGEAAFARVILREEAYPGPMCAQAPDLLLIPQDESLMVVPSLTGETWGLSQQTGLHRYEGMWIHASPRTRAGRLARNVHITDVVPTLLADLEMSVPEFMQGDTRREIFLHDAPGRSREHAPYTPSPQPEDGSISEAEEDELTFTRLREMGYL
jgi:predicted AlkP superfamily phosphohydrolase/phosphomutase